MRPLGPDERAEILARNPGATEADLEAFDDLLHQRQRLGHPVFEPEGDQEGTEATRLARLRAVEASLAEMETRLFPHWQEAIAAVAERRIQEDEEPLVG